MTYTRNTHYYKNIFMTILLLVILSSAYFFILIDAIDLNTFAGMFWAISLPIVCIAALYYIMKNSIYKYKISSEFLSIKFLFMEQQINFNNIEKIVISYNPLNESTDLFNKVEFYHDDKKTTIDLYLKSKEINIILNHLVQICGDKIVYKK